MDLIGLDEEDNNSADSVADLQSASILRVKTATRLKYEAQVNVIIDQIGDLEKIRKKLDLTQRKIAQLLLIDPSSWSR